MGFGSTSEHRDDAPTVTTTLSLAEVRAKKRSLSSIRIVNVVMEADLGQTIDLGRFAASPWGHYSSSRAGAPASFNGIGIRAKVLVTKKGKMIVSGATSETEAKRAIIRAAKILVKERFAKSIPRQFHVLNVVAIGLLCCKIDLEVVASSLKGSVYDPQQFPAVMLQFGEDHSTHFSLFSNGRFVVTGAKSVNAAAEVATLFAEYVAGIS